MIRSSKDETDELVEFSVHGKLLSVYNLVINSSIQKSLWIFLMQKIKLDCGLSGWLSGCINLKKLDRWFERLIITVILLNSILLAI